MKSAKTVDFTFMGYLHSNRYAKATVDEQELRRMLAQFKKVPNFLAHIYPVCVVINYTTRGYLSISENIKQVFGYHPDAFLEGGLSFMVDTMEKKFFNTLDQHLFPSTMTFLNGLPQRDHINYTFSYNSRLKNPSGDWLDLYQRGTFITSRITGLPLYCLALCYDITPLKRDSTMIRTIEQTEAGKVPKIIQTDYFYPYQEDALLTKQEKNILKYMMDGLSSKMIADKLKISENTVSNHRQNMLKKTNTKNVAQLAAFAITHSII